MKEKLFNLFLFVMGAFDLIVSKSSNDWSLGMPEHEAPIASPILRGSA